MLQRKLLLLPHPLEQLSHTPGASVDSQLAMYMSNSPFYILQIFGALNQNDSQLVPNYPSLISSGRRLSQSLTAPTHPASAPQSVSSSSLQYISAGSPELFDASLEWTEPLNGTITV